MLTTRYILDEAHLKHYDERLKSWASSQPVKTLPSTLYPWTQTAKAGAVTCWPVGGTELKPTVDYIFTETPPSNGQPKAPDNPSTITGVSSVKATRCGKNLCPLVGDSSSSYISVSFTDNGEFVFNGSYAGLVDVYVFNKTYDIKLFPDYLERGKTYTFSLQGDNSSVKFQVYVYQSNNYGGAVVSIVPGESRTYTIPDTQSMILRFSIPANTVLNNAKFKLQIEEGSSATEFGPYAGTDYTIPLGNTYYGGSVDLATGVMTVTWVEYIVTGLEDWSNFEGISGGLVDTHFVAPDKPQMSSILNATTRNCSHFVFSSSNIANTFYTWQTSWRFGVRLDPDDYANVAAFKSWLAGQYTAGTPVTLTYQLATPYTVQLSPVQISALAQTDKFTPKLNTVYSNQSAVQVGYVKSPIREEYELTQAIVAQGGNI